MLEKENIENQAKESASLGKDAAKGKSEQEVINEAQAAQSNIEAEQQINDVRERFGK
ncbi:hypothetical protein [uncultured Rothia sp.]|uniref:hypothetical protein n=1 Tax=uncultured Rothia sp. TaxID=316088 RepID=UPI003217D9C4